MAAHIASTRPGADLAQADAAESTAVNGAAQSSANESGLSPQPHPPAGGASPARPRPLSTIRAMHAKTSADARTEAEQLLFDSEVRLLCLPRLAALLARDKARGIAAVVAVRRRRRQRLV